MHPPQARVPAHLSLALFKATNRLAMGNTWDIPHSPTNLDMVPRRSRLKMLKSLFHRLWGIM